jgi:putative membrane protein
MNRKSDQKTSQRTCQRTCQKRTWTIGVTAAALVLGSGVAMAQQPQPIPRTVPADRVMAPLSAGDQQFILDAVRGSEREVDMGDLAREKAQNARVKEFGTRMVQDHQRAAQELKQLAAAKGLRVKDTKLGGEQPPTSWLEKLSPAQFDREYVNAMVTDHEKDVAEFRRMSRDLNDPDLRAWAAKTLPTLEDHLQTVKDLQSKVVGSVR